MALTPNYGFQIPVGSDTVNLLTQCYPNFSSLDGILKAISDNAISTATQTKAGTVHQLVRTDTDRAVFRFVATANYTSGDTFTVDGVAVTATAVDGTSLDTGAFVINQNVLCIINGTVLTVFVKGGAGSASGITYDNTGSGITATNVQDALDEVVTDIGAVDAKYSDAVTGTIVAGNTSITLSSASILATSLLDVYFSDPALQYTAISAGTGSVTINIDAQASNVGVIVKILNL